FGSEKFICVTPRYGGSPWSLHDSKENPPVIPCSPAFRAISFVGSRTCALASSSDSGANDGFGGSEGSDGRDSDFIGKHPPNAQTRANAAQATAGAILERV